MIEILPSHWTEDSIVQYLPPQNVSLMVTEFGRDNFQRQKALPPRTSLSYAIHVILNGKGTYTLGTKNFAAQEGDVLIATPGHKICYTPDENEPWTYSWILFNGNNAPNLLEEINFNLDKPVYTLKNKKEAFSIVNSLFKKNRKDQHFQLRAFSALCHLFALLTEETCNTQKKRLYESSSYVQAAIRIIESQYCVPEFSVSDICKKLAINQTYLCQLFQKHAHTTATRYLIEYRILQARVLLDQGLPSIKETAYAVGYKDCNHFIKQFKKIVGCTPKQYQLLQKKLESSP